MKKLTFAYLLCILFFISPSAYSITEPGGAYATDKSNRSTPRVYTLAFQPGQLWDYLLCVSKSGKENHPNANWIAMIDNNACLNKSGFTTSIDPDAGNVPEYAKFYNSSTRADNNSDQIIRGWKINKNGNYLLSKATFKTDPTTANPNGEWDLYYDIIEQAGDEVGDQKGFMSSTVGADGNTDINMAISAGVKNYQLESAKHSSGLSYDPNYLITMRLNAELVPNAGVSTLKSAQGTSLTCAQLGFAAGSSVTDPLTASCGSSTSDYLPAGEVARGMDVKFKFNFDGDYANINTQYWSMATGTDTKVLESTACYDLNNTTKIAFEYDLYEKDSGAKISFNGPFQFTRSWNNDTGADDGKRGYFSHWGAYVNGDYLETDDRIKKSDGTEYTIKASSGKMWIKKANTKTFNSADSIFDTNSCTVDNTAGSCSKFQRYLYIQNKGGNWVDVYIKLDGSTPKYYSVRGVTGFLAKDAVLNDGSSDSVVSQGDYLINKEDWMHYSLTSIPTAAAPTTATGVYYTNDQVSYDTFAADTGQSTEVTLTCYRYCPKPSATVGGSLAQGFSFAAFEGRNTYSHETPSGGGSGKIYKFKKDDMSLYLSEGGTDYLIGPAYTPVKDSNGNYNYKYWWVDAAFVIGTKSDWSDLYTTDKLFAWQMSDAPWGSLLMAMKDGTPVSIDPPKRFPYTHTTANDRNNSSTNDGKVYNFEYSGEGNLWGWGYTTDASGMSMPSLIMRDGTEVDVDGDGTTDHVLLGKRLENRLPTVDASNCSSLSLDNLETTHPLPDPPSTSVISSKITHSAGDEFDLSLLSPEACYIDGVRQTANSPCN
tara:strand:+ start:790 stop:3258 length:2469 start_codon:yes stop_codon:yes gene_type:complete